MEFVLSLFQPINSLYILFSASHYIKSFSNSSTLRVQLIYWEKMKYHKYNVHVHVQRIFRCENWTTTGNNETASKEICI